MDTSTTTAIVTAIIAFMSAIIASTFTYFLTRRRELEADWRKLKLTQYQEYIFAISGIVGERSTPEGQLRYVDAVNNMMLVAPQKVLLALQQFTEESSYGNKNRTSERWEGLLNILVRAMREDTHFSLKATDPKFRFSLIQPRSEDFTKTPKS